MKKVLLIAAIAAASVVGAMPASANTVCGQGMIRNTYGFISNGFVSGGPACASTGTITFSSSTVISVNYRTSCNNDTTDSATVTGTYTLAANCIGTATGGGQTYQFTVVNGGNGLVFIQYSSGVVLSGTAIKT